MLRSWAEAKRGFDFVIRMSGHVPLHLQANDRSLRVEDQRPSRRDAVPNA